MKISWIIWSFEEEEEQARCKRDVFIDQGYYQSSFKKKGKSRYTYLFRNTSSNDNKVVVRSPRLNRSIGSSSPRW